MLNISIVSGPENASPRVLAETLQLFIEENGHNAEIHYKPVAFKRLWDHRTVKKNKVLWFIYCLLYFYGDLKLINSLKKTDAVILCGTIPYSFYRSTYNIERLKLKLKNKPVLYYGVRYLGDAPNQIKKLEKGNHSLIERFDWHLTVASGIKMEKIPTSPWNQIGLNLKCTGLCPNKKENFIAIVDFAREGFEYYRQTQIKALEELSIPYISLEKSYTIKEIREIYKKAAILFIQFPESYGMPIAECLSCGTYIASAEPHWPMAWRIDKKSNKGESENLPECFLIYNGFEDLKKKLKKIYDNYSLTETPQKVFDTFYKYYPTFYDGNKDSLLEVFNRIEQNSYKY